MKIIIVKKHLMFLFLNHLRTITVSNSVVQDQIDQTARFVQSDLDLHCSQKGHRARLSSGRVNVIEEIC